MLYLVKNTEIMFGHNTITYTLYNNGRVILRTVTEDQVKKMVASGIKVQ